MDILSPSVARRIYVTYLGKSHVYDDLNEYMDHGEAFLRSINRYLKEYSLTHLNLDSGRLSDLRKLPSHHEAPLIRILVDHAQSKYLKLQSTRKSSPEREGFLHSIQAAFGALPDTKLQKRIIHYFNVAVQKRKERNRPELPHRL